MQRRARPLALNPYTPCSGVTVSIDFRLYLITDRHVTKKPLIEAVRLALEGGVRAVQLREKDLPIRDLLSLARDMRQLTSEFKAKLFINDRVDIAQIVGADGVHVGVTSIPVHAIRYLVGNDLIIGASTHNRAEAISAQSEGADFITYGPIYETPSKIQFGLPVGCDSLICIKKELNIQVFGLGGVKSGNMRPVFGAGADGVAMISGILAADDIKLTSRKILEGIGLMEKLICHECGRR